ncbi:MAG TPA: DUF922 domain-containing protein [Vicinamibacterales bacterium]|nr:DUF922 domain-containing protein [Vicinamibacterales bacterium]
MSRLLVAAVAAIATVTAGCGPVAVSQPPAMTLAQSIDAQVARNEAVPWSAKRPLVWADFRATPPSTSSAAAETAYTLFHGARCTRSRFEFLVVAAFRPKASWVRPAILKVPADSARALRHEQTHFDIAELHARRMRRYFAEMLSPCQASTEQIQAFADRFIRDERVAQDRYDAETNHSRDSVRQGTWDKDVAQQLQALNRFVR